MSKDNQKRIVSKCKECMQIMDTGYGECLEHNPKEEVGESKHTHTDIYHKPDCKIKKGKCTCTPDEAVRECNGCKYFTPPLEVVECDGCVYTNYSKDNKKTDYFSCMKCGKEMDTLEVKEGSKDIEWENYKDNLKEQFKYSGSNYCVGCGITIEALESLLSQQEAKIEHCSVEDCPECNIGAFKAGEAKIKREFMEEIEGMKQTINPGGALDKSLDNAHKYGYNQALDTITSKLKEIIRNVER